LESAITISCLPRSPLAGTHVFIRFGPEARPSIEAQGLRWTSIEEIFLCLRYSGPQISLLPGCPVASIQYQIRESQASGQTVLAVQARSFQLPNPWTGDSISSNITSTFFEEEEIKKYQFIPLIYGFGRGEGAFWAVSCDLTGRVVHLFFPSLGLVVYEMNIERARRLDFGFQASRSDLERRRDAYYNTSPQEIVGVLDMVTNFGHQLIHHLSGIELLVGSGLHQLIDQYWVCGRDFFGPLEDLYPEIKGKVKYFAEKGHLARQILAEPTLAVRIGSNCFYERTRRRILRAAVAKYTYPVITDRFPIIAVTVRTTGRVCVNLPELVGKIYQIFHPRYPTLGFIVDGWVFGESEIVALSNAATCIDLKHHIRMTGEFAAAQDVIKMIPASAIVRNLVGKSILDSISGLLDIDAYVSHVGTLQHKIAFFSLARGITHGPKAQMSLIDSGAFQAELGQAPVYIDSLMVEDLNGDPSRGPSFNDYKIIDVNGCVAKLWPLIAPTEGGR
jgi:hypothetical protein